jgi:hypothetical protein
MTSQRFGFAWRSYLEAGAPWSMETTRPRWTQPEIDCSLCQLFGYRLKPRKPDLVLNFFRIICGHK